MCLLILIQCIVIKTGIYGLDFNKEKLKRTIAVKIVAYTFCYLTKQVLKGYYRKSLVIKLLMKQIYMGNHNKI